MSHHTVSCAIISLSRQLLSSGLLNLIKSSAIGSYRKTGKTLSSQGLFLLTHKILRTKTDDVISTLIKLINNYCVDNTASIDLACYLCQGLCGYLFTRPIEQSDGNIPFSQDNFRSCNISIGSHGRMMTTSNGVGRGHILLHESPLCAVVKSSCSCHEHIILHEYVTLAWGMALLLHVDDNGYKAKSPQEIECWHSFASSPLNPHQKQALSYILSTFQSGQGPNVLNNLEIDEKMFKTSFEWSLELQSLMAVISSVCSIYTSHAYSHSIDLSSSTIFDILSRLPANIHSVSYVTSQRNGRHEEIIEQTKLGFGLFCHASAVNHSCKPNSIIKYNFSLIRDRDDDVSPLQLLSSSSIAIVPLQSIGTCQEVTVSYGPMHGVHCYNSRQEILLRQYLFNCRCICCEDDLRQQPLHSEMNDGLVHDTAYESSHIGEVVALCRDLDLYRLKVDKITSEVTSLLASNASSGRLQSYHEVVLSPLKDALDVCKSRHLHAFGLTDRRTGSKIDADIYNEFVGVYTVFLDIEARLLSHVGRYIDAAKLVAEATNLLISSGKYTSDDIAMQRECIKQGQLYFNAGDFKTAKTIVSKAVNALRDIAHNDDPDLVEGLCMLRYLQAMKSS